MSISWDLEQLEVCESTQERAVELIRQGNYTGPFAISTVRQTKGVGQRGAPWIDSGKSVLLSLAWQVNEKYATPDERWPSWISLWVRDALVDFAPELATMLKLKWPNDLVVEEKKLGGTLVNQLIHQRQVYRVAGIGVNVAWVVPPPKTALVTDLESLLFRPIDTFQILVGILEATARGLQAELDVKDLDTKVRNLRPVTI
jgi:BirA family biotin operon repressor/biotin-[acetyl-CoA-carboxylase] ligase